VLFRSDDILNAWDGIIETPGRILIISSNHYEKLDPALVRPGRIDITLELLIFVDDIFDVWIFPVLIILPDIVWFAETTRLLQVVIFDDIIINIYLNFYQNKI